MAAEKFKLIINALNGQILRTPREQWFDCDLVVPLGLQVIRQYDGNECINAKKVYLLAYQGMTFGTDVFSTMDGYVEYRNANCDAADPCCYILFGDCYITYNGRKISI